MLVESNGESFSHLIPLKGTHSFLSTQNCNLEAIKTTYPKHTFIEMTQPHGSDIAIINQPKTQSPLAVDACITSDPQTMLVVRTADCLPILIATDTYLLAAIHAGRKSTEQQLTEKVCKKLCSIKAFRYVHIWFGPCICKSCYEIDANTRLHYDLIKENIQQIKQGLSSSITFNIFQSGMCTLCSHNHLFYSHRAGNLKRFYSGISWQK